MGDTGTARASRAGVKRVVLFGESSPAGQLDIGLHYVNNERVANSVPDKPVDVSNDCIVHDCLSLSIDEPEPLSSQMKPFSFFTLECKWIPLENI